MGKLDEISGLTDVYGEWTSCVGLPGGVRTPTSASRPVGGWGGDVGGLGPELSISKSKEDPRPLFLGVRALTVQVGEVKDGRGRPLNRERASDSAPQVMGTGE